MITFSLSEPHPPTSAVLDHQCIASPAHGERGSGNSGCSAVSPVGMSTEPMGLQWSVTTNLDPTFSFPPGPYISKYLDPRNIRTPHADPED